MVNVPMCRLTFWLQMQPFMIPILCRFICSQQRKVWNLSDQKLAKSIDELNIAALWSVGKAFRCVWGASQWFCFQNYMKSFWDTLILKISVLIVEMNILSEPTVFRLNQTHWWQHNSVLYELSQNLSFLRLQIWQTRLSRIRYIYGYNQALCRAPHRHFFSCWCVSCAAPYRIVGRTYYLAEITIRSPRKLCIYNI